MVNVTHKFFSALLAIDVKPATYKPSPEALKAPKNSSTQAGANPDFGHLLMGPQNITFLPKVSDMSDPICHVEAYDGPPVGFQEYPPYDEAIATIFRYRQQQAVNLGSWFVHESWMTPSVFDCAAGDGVGEIDIAHGWGSVDSARAVLERHWDTFITASDFEWLSRTGINTVRLPIGYWNLGPEFCWGTPFADVAEVYQNSWSRVVRAINMAGMYGIGVLVDLHGAVGSQNGQDHSGVSDGQMGLFSDAGNEDKTINVLTYLTKKLVHVNNVVGIEILNEPKYVEELEGFYGRAIDAMRAADPDAAKFPLYVHNGFDLDRFSQYLSGRRDFTVQDHHSYFVYTDSDRQESAVQHAQDIGNTVSSFLQKASDQVHRNMIVGEYSCALTPESMAQNPVDGDKARKDFCGGQVDTYAARTGGWHFWSYMKEGCDQDPGWCFRSAVGTVLPSQFFSYKTPTSAYRKHATAEFTNENYSDGVNHPFSLNAEDLPVIRKRALSLSPRDPSQRFQLISQKRRDDTTENPASDLADTHGYNDGKLTAQVFALHNMSKLGFINQFISDSIEHLGPDVVPPGSEGKYYDGFWSGLWEAQDSLAVST